MPKRWNFNSPNNPINENIQNFNKTFPFDALFSGYSNVPSIPQNYTPSPSQSLMSSSSSSAPDSPLPVFPVESVLHVAQYEMLSQPSSASILSQKLAHFPTPIAHTSINGNLVALQPKFSHLTHYQQLQSISLRILHQQIFQIGFEIVIFDI